MRIVILIIAVVFWLDPLVGPLAFAFKAEISLPNAILMVASPDLLAQVWPRGFAYAPQRRRINNKKKTL